MHDLVPINDEGEPRGRHLLLGSDRRLRRYLGRARVPDADAEDNRHASLATRKVTGISDTVTIISTAASYVAHSVDAERLVDAGDWPTPAVVSRAMSDAEEESEGGVSPLVELLGAVPRIVARRVRHVCASENRHRATLRVIAEVFLALADEQLLRRDRRAPPAEYNCWKRGRELGNGVANGS